MTNKEEILQSCTIEGNIIKLPNQQLDRQLYQEVAKVLQLIGGKWKGGKTAGFVFQTDPSNLLKQIASGEKRNLKKEFQFFATPAKLAQELVKLAEIQPGDSVLEPSAGQGAIIREINKVSYKAPDCYELMEVNICVLEESDLKYRILGKDFMQHDRKQYSKIIANPPFTKNQDINHIREMFQCLMPGGRLVSISSASWETGSQVKQKAFRLWLRELKATIIDIPPGAFKESGTMVGGKIIVINKPMNHFF